MNRRSKRRSRGSVAVEFALCSMPFCVMLLGMIDYGWYFYVDLVATNAVREGARTATTIAGACANAPATNAGVAAMSSYITPLLSYAATKTCVCETLASGDPSFTCSVQIDFTTITGSSLIPMPGGSSGTTSVKTSATMRGVP